MSEQNQNNNQRKSQKTESIALSTTSGVTRWLGHRMATYNSSKEAFILAITLFTAFIGGPALVFYGMSWFLADSLGTSGGGAAALSFNGILYLILLVLAAIISWIVISVICKPSNLLISPIGLQYQFRTLLGYKSRLSSWKDVSYLIIYKPKNKTNPAHYQLSFLNGTKRMFNIPLGWLNSPENREQLLSALNKYLSDIPRDYEVPFYLQPPSAQTYTDIWFQSLRNIPELEKLVLNEEEASN